MHSSIRLEIHALYAFCCSSRNVTVYLLALSMYKKAIFSPTPDPKSGKQGHSAISLSFQTLQVQQTTPTRFIVNSTAAGSQNFLPQSKFSPFLLLCYL